MLILELSVFLLSKTELRQGILAVNIIDSLWGPRGPQSAKYRRCSPNLQSFLYDTHRDLLEQSTNSHPSELIWISGWTHSQSHLRMWCAHPRYSLVCGSAKLPKLPQLQLLEPVQRIIPNSPKCCDFCKREEHMVRRCWNLGRWNPPAHFKVGPTIQLGFVTLVTEAVTLCINLGRGRLSPFNLQHRADL